MTHLGSKVIDKVAEIKAMSAFQLAEMAGCAQPDDKESPGADFLDTVRAVVLEAWGQDGADAEQSDYIANIVTVYTHPAWKLGTDLCVWEHADEIAELMGDNLERVEGLDFMTRGITIGCTLIAEWLWGAIFSELEAAQEEDDADA